MSRARRLSLWVPVVLYMAAIFFVSGLQVAPLPEEVSDKTAHIWAYAGLAVLSVRAVGGGLPCRGRVPRRVARARRSRPATGSSTKFTSCSCRGDPAISSTGMRTSAGPSSALGRAGCGVSLRQDTGCNFHRNPSEITPGVFSET